MISGIFRATVWSQTIPESMRGRLAGIEMLSYSIGPLAGQVRGGVTADLWSVRGAVTSGGLACVAGVGITAALAARLLDLRQPHRRARRRRARHPRGGRRELTQDCSASQVSKLGPRSRASGPGSIAPSVRLFGAATGSTRMS